LLLLDHLQQENSGTSRCYSAVPVSKNRGILRPARFLAVFSLQITAKTAAALGSPDGRRRSLRLLIDQPVEFGGVLAGDFVHDFGREAGELLLDVFRGFGPDAGNYVANASSRR